MNMNKSWACPTSAFYVGATGSDVVGKLLMASHHKTGREEFYFSWNERLNKKIITSAMFIDFHKATPCIARPPSYVAFRDLI